MADLAIMDAAGYPKRSIPVAAYIHDDMIRLAEALSGYPLIARMSEYYEDAEYTLQEVNQLLSEVRRLRKDAELKAFPPPRAELLDLLDDIADLCEQALGDQLHIMAIAD